MLAQFGHVDSDGYHEWRCGIDASIVRDLLRHVATGSRPISGGDGPERDRIAAQKTVRPIPARAGDDGAVLHAGMQQQQHHGRRRLQRMYARWQLHCHCYRNRFGECKPDARCAAGNAHRSIADQSTTAIFGTRRWPFSLHEHFLRWPRWYYEGFRSEDSGVVSNAGPAHGQLFCPPRNRS